MAVATFAGGCFWCLVKPFDQFEGVECVVSGYSGGHVVNPTYKEVCSNTTGHREAVQITFNDEIISYEDIVRLFFKTFDPTDAGGQFYDRGESYQSAIFYHDKNQQQIAQSVIDDLENKKIFNAPIVTPVIAYKNFYEAEEYHQDFYKKDPDHYNAYKNRSGRQQFIDNHWG